MTDQIDPSSGQLARAFDDLEYEEQCQVSSHWSASRLLLLASLFLYGTFVFAYFYLRALNNHGLWRIGDQHASAIIGTTIAVLVVLSGLIHYIGARRLQIGSRVDWQVGALVSLILIAVATGLQIWDLTRLPFRPASSAYTGIFITWSAVYIVYLLGQFYWLETLLAQSIANRRSVLQETPEGLIVVSRFGANVEGYVLFSQFMVIATIVMWLLFYIV